MVGSSLPPGMAIHPGRGGDDPMGFLACGYNGTPTTAGTWSFSMRVEANTANGHSASAFGPATKAFTQIVRPDPGSDPALVVGIGVAETRAVLGEALPIAGSVSGNGAVTTWWSKEWGPGEVVFGDAGALVTTATFSWSGLYGLRLYADDGVNMWQWGTVFVTVRRDGAGAPANLPPAITTGIAADPAPVTGITTQLSVGASDDGGAAQRTYRWSVSGPGPVAFTPDGANVAAATVATFQTAGDYLIQVEIGDAQGASITDTLALEVEQTGRPDLAIGMRSQVMPCDTFDPFLQVRG